MGILATLLGMLIIMFALVTPSGDGTANLDMMNLKTNPVIAGAALFLGGIITNAASKIVRAVDAQGED